MIEKLLGEPYWDTIDSDLSSFLKEHNGFEANISDSHRVLSAYIFRKVIHPIEHKYFGGHNDIEPNIRYNIVALSEQGVINSVKEKLSYSAQIAKSDIAFYFLNFDYDTVTGLSKILLLEPSVKTDAYMERKVNAIKNKNDMNQLFRDVKDLTEYKILNSPLYKEMKP